MPRLDSFFLRLPMFQSLSDRNMRLLYVVRILRDLLNKITLFFMPIFLFEFGKDTQLLSFLQLTHLQAGMVMIAAFYLVHRATMFFSAIPCGKLIMKIGFDSAITLSYLLRVGVFAALYFSFQYEWLLFLAAALEGLQTNFFWNSFFTALTKSVTERFGGSELGTLQFLIQLAAVLTPALSGYLAFQYGYEVLFLLGMAFSLISAIFAVHLRFQLAKDTVSWKEFGTWLKDPAFLRLTSSFVGRYLNDSLLFLWPLYVFLLLGAVDRVGFLYTFSLFLSMIFTYFIGTYINRYRGGKPFALSGGVLTMLWVARTQFLSIWSFALIDTAERLFANAHWLIYDWLFIRQGKGAQAFSYFVYREMVVSVAAFFFWIVFGGFFLVTESWNALFLFGGVGVLLSLLISNNHDKIRGSR